MQIKKFAVRSLAILSIVAQVSCSDEEIVVSPSEKYTRDFVKEFGTFKAESWSEAVSGAITVVTEHSTPVDVFAEVNGRRFIFASLGGVRGVQPIIVNVPRTVKELIVVADGKEYCAPLGSVIDLSTKGRLITELTYGPVTSLEGFKGEYYPDVNREIQLKGNILKTSYLNNSNRDGGFHIGSSEKNFRYDTDKIYCASRYKVNKTSLWMTIYPMYWRENKYGESDYLLGFYI